MTLTFQPLELSLYTHEACQISFQLQVKRETRESQAAPIGRSVKLSHSQSVQFKKDTVEINEAETFTFDVPVFFEKYKPVKEFATLRFMKNKSEKVADFQIEITNFIGEEFQISDLELGLPSGKPAPIIVRAFKFKCML